MSDEPDLDSAYALETPDDNKALYRAWAETYDADFVDGTGFRMPEVIVGTYQDFGGRWPCLDVGCGTGALAGLMPADAVLDGLDLSPEMLAVAARKGRYRSLIEANLMAPLSLPPGAYAGIISSGTFTHGHVDATPLPALAAAMTSGGLAVLSVKEAIWESHGFAAAMDRLIETEVIASYETRREKIYANPGLAPPDHGDDIALVLTFETL